MTDGNALSWEVRLGDGIAGMRSLPDASVDVTIMDPPYETEAHTLQRRKKGRTRKPGGGEASRAVTFLPLSFPAITPQMRLEAAAEVARVTRSFAVTFCQGEAIGDWKRAFQAHGLKYRRSIPWVKPDAMPSLHGRWPGQAYEAMVISSWHDEEEWEALVVASRSSARPCPIGGKAIEYRFTREARGGPAPHETTKPFALMMALVEHFSHPGDLVLDPFAGSCTTGIACRRLGRSFLGWEIDPDVHAVSARRLVGDEAKPNAAQPSLFGALENAGADS